MASQDTQPFHWRYAELNDKDFEIHGRTLFFIVVVFGVVLLFILVVLYIHWVCRYHHHHFPTTLFSHGPHAPHAPSLGPRGLNRSGIQALPITLHRLGATSNESVAESECCICLGVFEDGDKVKVLPRCGHCFHSDCVDRWLITHSNCPLCRASLRIDSSLVSIVTE